MYLKEFYHEKGTRTAWPYLRWHRNRDDGPPEPPLMDRITGWKYDAVMIGDTS